MPPVKTRCKLPALGSASNMQKVIDEEVKVAIDISLERFLCSQQRGTYIITNIQIQCLHLQISKVISPQFPSQIRNGVSNFPV